MGSNADLRLKLTAFDHTGPGMASAARHAQKLDRTMGRLRSSMRLMGVATAAAAGYFAVDSVKAYAAAEESQRKLQTAFEKFPKLSNTSIESLRRLNSEMQRKTKYDDDDLALMQSRLAKFDLTGKQLEQITPLIADYATATGKDVVSAGDQFGKALLGNTRALKAIGITGFKPTGKAAKDYADLVDRISKKVGGASAAEYDTAAVKLAILQNQYGELKETVGGALLPVLTELTQTMTANMPAIQAAVQRNMPTIKSIFGNIAGAARAAGSFVGKAYKVFASLPPGVQDASVKIAGIAAALGLISKSPIGKGSKLIVDIVGGAFKAVRGMAVTAGVVNVNGKIGGAGGLGGPGGLLAGVPTLPITLGAAAGAAIGFAVSDPISRAIARGLGGGRGKQPQTAEAKRGLVKDPVSDLVAALNSRSLPRATRAYSQALATSRASGYGDSRGLGVRDVSGLSQRNKAALQGQAQAAKALTAAYAASNVTSGQVAAKQAQLARQFVKTAVGMGVPRAAAKRYAREIGLLPSRKTTKISAPGADESKRKMQATSQAANRIPQQKMTKVRGENSDALAKIRNVERQQIPAKTVQILGNNSDAFTKLWDFLKAPAQKLVPILGSLFSASGGPVYGPGTSTSDSIPARLSNGEYVIRARSVRRYGLGFLNLVNRGDYEPGMMRFKNGGLGWHPQLGTPFSAYLSEQDETGKYREQIRDAIHFPLMGWIKRNKRPGFRKRNKGESDFAYEAAMYADRNFNPNKDKKWRDRFRASAQMFARQEAAKVNDPINSAVAAFRDQVGGQRQALMSYAGLGGFGESLGSLTEARNAIVSAGTPAERAAAKANLDAVTKSANPLSYLQSRLSTLRTFNSKVATLRAKPGVPLSLIQEVIAAGPETGIALADAIMGPDMATIFKTWTDIEGAANTGGIAATQINVRGNRDSGITLNSALNSAYGNSTTAANKIEIGLYIDGKDIAAALKRNARQSGYGTGV